MPKIKENGYREQYQRFVFECPGCNMVHTIDTSWTWNGNVDMPTFSPSYLTTNWNGLYDDETRMIRCHSYINDGLITFLTDCTHQFAGKTVEIPEFTKTDIYS